MGVTFIQLLIFLNKTIFCLPNYQQHLLLVNIFQVNDHFKKAANSKFYQSFLKQYRTKIKKYYLILLNLFMNSTVFISKIIDFYVN